MTAVLPFLLLGTIILTSSASSTECAEDDQQTMVQMPPRSKNPLEELFSALEGLDTDGTQLPRVGKDLGQVAQLLTNKEGPAEKENIPTAKIRKEVTTITLDMNRFGHPSNAKVINTVGIDFGAGNDGSEADAVKKACKRGKGTAQIKRLDLDTGAYTDLCDVVGVCLNACGIHPQTNLIYCNNRPGSDNLVRVDCDINIADLEKRNQEGTLAEAEAVTGTVCYLGQLQETFAANFDEKGDFWFKQNVGEKKDKTGDLFLVTNETLDSLTGQTSVFTSGRIAGAATGEEVVSDRDLKSLADFNIVTREFPELNVGEQDYIVGCWSNEVIVQQVGVVMCVRCWAVTGLCQVSGDLTNAEPIVLTMREIDPVPGQNKWKASGAQWLFNGSIYCAYNDGTPGLQKGLPWSSMAGVLTNSHYMLVLGQADGQIPRARFSTETVF
eukprot:Skav201084  [mRNA]  locus=scaffold2138:143028:149923:- [translate_table: standard]